MKKNAIKKTIKDVAYGLAAMIVMSCGCQVALVGPDRENPICISIFIGGAFFIIVREVYKHNEKGSTNDETK